ncbi:response regulator [Catenulispora subtropica]|uniref:Response regulatory domain-containing protein n=1 Tax=Catenulispora subtropica TaxID=450798 RepID=A0ABN2RRH8_9ACTN
MADHPDARRAPAAGTPRAPAGPAPPAFDGQKVLIVDDDPRGVYALGSALALRGLTVVHAATGREGIAVLRKDPGIRAVLLDIAMPDVDGYATAAAIRGLDGCGGLPIIAVTFEASAADRAKCLAAGMDEHVPKPVDVELLLRVLHALIG